MCAPKRMRVTQFPGYRGVHLLSPALADVDTTLNFAWEGGGWGTIRDLFVTMNLY